MLSARNEGCYESAKRHWAVAYVGQTYYTSKCRRFEHEYVKCHHKEMACYLALLAPYR